MPGSPTHQAIRMPLYKWLNRQPRNAAPGVLAAVLWLCALATGGLATAVSAADSDFPGLQALMTDQQFDEAGLNGLSPAQRASLNRWLAEYAVFKLEAAPEPAIAPSSNPEAETETETKTENEQPKPQARVVAKPITAKDRRDRETIRTRIVGKFNGWQGKTLFVLENGQTWRQRSAGRYFYRAESPEVELFKNRLGFWELRILATGKTVKISRYRR